MDLDLRTLFVAHALVSLTLGGLMTVFWRTQRALPGLGCWALGTVAVGVAICAGALRGLLPDLASVVVGNALGLGGMAAFWAGIRRFNGRPAAWPAALAVIVPTVALLVHQTVVVDDVPARIALASAVMTLGAMACAAELLRAPRQGRQGQRGTAVTAAVLFAAVALSFAVRTAGAMAAPAGSGLFATAVATQSIHFLVSLVGQVLTVMALLMMAMDWLNRQVDARSAALEVARDRAEAGSRAKSVFLAGLSHELRTPLNAVIGFSGMIREEAWGPVGDRRYPEAAADIQESGRHLLDLINRLLDMASLEADRYTLVEGKVDLRRAVLQAARVAAAAAGSGPDRVTVEIAEPGPVVVADERALRQMLLNLLSNALKFTTDGGPVTVRATVDRDGLLLEVIDQGVGIPAAAIAELGQPFVQARRDDRVRREGTGIGLFVTRRLVEVHGGRMSIASRLGEGTRVAIRLPPERLA